jgi:hypothetical protein
MDGMCQTAGNYMMMSNEQNQRIEPIVYMKEDECPNNEEPANSGASYVELRSLVEVPIVSSSAENAKRHENIPQL